MAKRGRPFGHKLSDKSKQKISESKTGQVHDRKTKKKISKSLIRYFKSDAGRAQKEKTSLYLSSFWNSDEGIDFRENLSQSMSQYYDHHFREQG